MPSRRTRVRVQRSGLGRERRGDASRLSCGRRVHGRPRRRRGRSGGGPRLVGSCGGCWRVVGRDVVSITSGPSLAITGRGSGLRSAFAAGALLRPASLGARHLGGDSRAPSRSGSVWNVAISSQTDGVSRIDSQSVPALRLSRRSGRVGPSRVGRAASDRAGARVGSGRAASGRAASDRARPGRIGPGQAPATPVGRAP